MTGSAEPGANEPIPAATDRTEPPSQSDAGNAELFDFVSMFCADRAENAVRPLLYYQQRFPGHETAIAAEYARLQRADQEAPEPTRRIGHYEVLSTLGSGGQGVVLLAEDTRLHRRVALKVLAPNLEFVSTERLQRFRREAEILSQLDHPAICQVYEADTCDGVPFLAMRHVEGRTLSAILRERRAAARLPRTRVELHEVVLWIEAAAHAVHEAHGHGIVHRDIKPGNLMITPQGTPVLLDFGLARTQGPTDLEITRTGDVLGTLAYMAPEVLTRRPTDHRADVYALGVTLFECLTHALPFTAESPSALWRAIETGAPTSPRHFNPAIPPELAAVVLTAIAPTPTLRYATAEELALDLERVRRREPIRARRVPVGIRAMRWVQRHPTWSLGIGATAALILVLATALERVAANERAASALNLAIQPYDTDDGAANALANLVGAAGRSPRTDLRNAMLQLLDACHLAWQVPRSRVPPFAVDPLPAADPSGRYIALGDHDGVVTVRNAADGTIHCRREVHRGIVTDLAFLDEQRLVSAGIDGARILAVGDLRELEVVPLPPSPDGAESMRMGAAIGVAADGQQIAIAASGAVAVVQTADWATTCSVRLDPTPTLRHVRFSADGRHLVVLGRDGGSDPHGCNRCWIVDCEQARVVARVDASEQAVVWAEWHPRRAAVALAFNGGRVEVRDGGDGAVRFQCNVDQGVNWCGFDPTGDLLLVPSDRGTDLWRWQQTPAVRAGHLAHPSERTVGAAQFDRERNLFAAVLRDGLVLVYSTVDWRLLCQFKVRVRDVRFLAWLPHSGSLLTADLSQLSSWFAGVRPHSPELWGHEEAVTTIAVSPDGSRILTGSRDRTARLWSLDEAAPLQVFAHEGPLRRVRYAPDGRRVLTVAEEPVVRVFDPMTGDCTATLRGHTGNVVDAWILGDGRRVVSIGEDGRAIVHDLQTGERQRVLQAAPTPLHCAAIHPLRAWIAVGGADRHVTVWNLDSGELVRRIRCSDQVDDWRISPVHQIRGIAFDSGTDRLMASLVNNFLLVWDIAADWRLQTFDGDFYGGPMVDDERSGTALCADYSFGRLTLFRDGKVDRLLRDGAPAHGNLIGALRIQAGGEIALSAGNDGQMFVWDLRDRTPIQAVRTGAAILDAEFSPDGAWVITAGADCRVKFWPRDPLAAARDYLARRDASRRR